MSEKEYVTREEHEALKQEFEELKRKCAPFVQPQKEVPVVEEETEAEKLVAGTKKEGTLSQE